MPTALLRAQGEPTGHAAPRPAASLRGKPGLVPQQSHSPARSRCPLPKRTVSSVAHGNLRHVF